MDHPAPPNQVHEDRSLELDADTMRDMVDAAMKRIVEHHRTLASRPGEDLDGAADLARSLREPLPENGEPFEALLALLFDRAIPKSITTGGPQQLSYIPGSGIFHAAVADLIADATNRFVGTWFPAPALAQLEANVVRWFCDLVGYPETAAGFLTPGGSTANLYALITARRIQCGDDIRDATLYAPEQAHASIVRSALLAGFASDRIRVVPCDDRFRMRVEALEAQIREDWDAGLRPAVVTANAGSTNTGAVDDLRLCAAVSRRADCWLHADAAYGGFFALTDRGKRALGGLELADSIALDPHKGLFLPYGTGALIVRDVVHLKRAHAVRAEYMPVRSDEDLIDFAEISPELSRDFRGLRVWLPLKMHGVGPFRTNLDEKMDLARWAYDEIRKIPHVRMLCEPTLSTFAFVVDPGGEDGPTIDALSQRVLGAVNRRGRIHLSGTWLNGRYAIRVSVLSFRTHIDRMRMLAEDLRSAVDEATR